MLMTMASVIHVTSVHTALTVIPTAMACQIVLTTAFSHLIQTKRMLMAMELATRAIRVQPALMLIRMATACWIALITARSYLILIRLIQIAMELVMRVVLSRIPTEMEFPMVRTSARAQLLELLLTRMDAVSPNSVHVKKPQLHG